MADLFTLPELAAYMQVPSVNEDTGDLLLELATGLIAEVYDPTDEVLPDPAPSRLKRIALEVVKRAYLNPNGYASENLADYGYRRGAEAARSGVFLTDPERASVVRASGRSTMRSVKLVTPFEFTDDDDLLDSWT